MPNFDRPIEINRIPASGARRSQCPGCGIEVITAAGTSFIAALQVGGGRVLPACPRCVAGEAPALAEAVECLNRLSNCLPALEWRHATRCIGALDVLAQEVIDSTSSQEVDQVTGGVAEARRATFALIARQYYGVEDLSIRDTVGAASPWTVIEILGSFIASKLKEDIGDVEGWLSSTFLEWFASGEGIE